MQAALEMMIVESWLDFQNIEIIVLVKYQHYNVEHRKLNTVLLHLKHKFKVADWLELLWD